MARDALRAIRPLTRKIRFRSIILPSILDFLAFFEPVFERGVEPRILKLRPRAIPIRYRSLSNSAEMLIIPRALPMPF
jgi:hypothetical protein